MLGHLAIGTEIVGAAAADLPDDRRLALLNCVLSHHGPDAGPGRARGGGRGFASAEALALYRLNALDASVKGALEHGSASPDVRYETASYSRSPTPRVRRSARRKNCPATNSSRAAKPSSRVRWETAFETTTPIAPRAETARRRSVRRGPGRCRSRAGARRRAIATGTIASSDVASARIWGSSRKIASAGTNRIPPPTPSSPPTHPAGEAEQRCGRRTPSGHDQLHRDRDEQQREQQRDPPLRQPLLERRPGDHPRDRRDADQRGLEDVDVSVQPLARPLRARR